MPLVSSNGVTVHYFDDPASAHDATETILMLHGFARNGGVWAGWLPRLTAGYRVLRPDIRGCGRSPDPGPDFVFHIDDVVADVINLMDTLSIDSVHYVGESTGGLVGAIAAATYPERFRSLTLVSTPMTTIRSDPKVKSPGADSPEESLRTLGLKQWWLRSRALTDDLFGDERDEAIAEEFAQTPVHVAVEMWRAMHQSSVTIETYLPKITVPTLLMSPTNSRTMSMADQEAVMALLQNGTHRVYDGASHGMYYLRADELASDLLQFLASK